jgi:hypothetical protein
VSAQKPEPAARFPVGIPPSVNNLFINVSTGRISGTRAKARIKGFDYRRWLHDEGWALKLLRIEPVPGIVRVLIEAPLHRRRDLDNALKPLLDLLVTMHIVENDNLIDDLRIVRAGTGDQVWVSIWPM